ncbi:MAG: hypothetical protein KJT03_03965, partial [Verrucomicrobiae bacterium]|nr:hypothetical protein [Verrucomicrobiae bacterium]
MIAGKSREVGDCYIMPGTTRNVSPAHSREIPVCGIPVLAGCILIFLTACGGPRDQGVLFKEGHPLEYREDQFGNRIPDFSMAGYKNGSALPDVPVVATLNPDSNSKDDTTRIQAAIDQIA